MDRKSDGLTRAPAGTLLPARGAFTAILLGLAGGAWLLSARPAIPDMRLGVLTESSMPAARDQMAMSGAMSMSLSDFMVTWSVMMVAMMVPSVVPVVRRFDRWMRATGQSVGASVLFLTGYLLVWSAVGGVAYLLVQALQSLHPAGSMTTLRVGAVLLVVAGAYQLSWPKQACLSRCRSPRTVVGRLRCRQVRGCRYAVRAGLGQGVYCLGSCWPLMLVLLLVGMMNLAWMAVIAAVILVEKAAPSGEVVSKVVGWVLVGWGIILLAAPHTLPALGGG